MIKPIFTEKTLKDAKQGKYTFLVGSFETKPNLKADIAKLFGVHVVSIKTVKKAGEKGRTVKGKKFSRLAVKKAIVTLKADEKIDLFEESKK